MAKINIPREDFPALKLVSEWDDLHFQALLKALNASKPKLTSRQFASEVAKSVKELPSDQVMPVLRLLFGLYALRERIDTPLDEFANLIAGAAAETRPKEFDGEKMVALATRLQTLLGFTNSLGVAVKASDILTEHEHVFCDARILSDIRPVFAEPPTSASASVIIHNLQIGFHDSGTGDHKEFYVALDTNDLDALKKIIMRAEQKTVALKSILEKANVPYLEPGA